MNFEQAKALRLQQWRSTLDDYDFRLQNPEAHRLHLHAMSCALGAEGLIDKFEQYDMIEMANAAYWHAVEELQSHPVRYCGASSYDVVACDSALKLGEIRQTIFKARRETRMKFGLPTTARSIATAAEQVSFSTHQELLHTLKA